LTLTVDISGDTYEIDPALLAELLDHAFRGYPGRPEGDWEMSVLLADTDTVIELHRQFFDDPSDTDVMSFPSGDLEVGDGNYLGDIAVSLSMAAVQAAEQGHSTGREIAYLCLHGMLHLLGHDDLTEEGKLEMLALQDAMLTAWEQARGCVL
jgi:probable rRNA maturation factor